MLWTPDPDEARESRVAGFARWVREHRDVGSTSTVDELDYAGLHDWSVRDLDGFWSAVAEHLGVIFHDPPTATLGRREMPGTAVVPGLDAQLRRARPHPRPGPGGRRRRRRRGRGGRDRDGSSPTPSCATSSPAPAPDWRRPGSGAATGSSRWSRTPSRRWWPSSRRPRWARCGRRARRTSAPRAVLDRFAQIEPTVLVAVDGYRYNGRAFDVRERVAGLQKALPTLKATVLVPHLDPDATLDGTVPWAELTAADRPAGVHAGALRPPAVGAVLVGDDRAAQGHRAVARRDRRRAPQGAGAAATTSARATGSCGSPPPAG